MIQNEYLRLECGGEKVDCFDKASNHRIAIYWNSIRLQCAEKIFTPVITEVSENSDFCEFRGKLSKIDFIAILKLAPDQHWCTLELKFINDNEVLPTPEKLIIAESEMLKFKPVGYKHQNAYRNEHGKGFSSQEGEEASGGKIPGCGYPVFSENFFVGVEHVAAYTLVKENGFICKHYPVWDGENTIAVPPLVIGCKAGFTTITKSFLDYIEKISIPKKQDPILCCCTFWSDPYLGDSEYKVSTAHYKRYIKQFLEAGIRPDMLMLDAGWNDRNSIFQAKKDIGGDKGLIEISNYLASLGIEFGLWTSINGNMGISCDWAKKQGYPIGTGIGAAYSAPYKFIVLPDNDFSKKLAERYVELMEKTKCGFFKIDWDCECATNDEFAEKYPTEDHIRTASIDIINKIHFELIKANPACLIRNGWWPSPWWLKDVTFTWLAHSGDCEYAALPSLTQRDSETTHRDAMYYYIFKESETPLPFDSIDNHEMIKAYRNPFSETHESWCNSVIMLYTRGTIYQSIMINAATLSDKQAKFFSETRSFAEKYKHILFNKSAQFIGKNPAEGEIYGFLHQSSDEAIAVIRNPSTIPQNFSLSEIASDIGFAVKQILVIYPYCGNMKFGNAITLLSHQVVMLYFKKEKEELPKEISETPFCVAPDGNTHLCAGLELDDSFGIIQENFIMVREISIENLGYENLNETIIQYLKIKIPDRMQNTCAFFKFTGADKNKLDEIRLRVYHDRYLKTGNGHAIPITTLYPKKNEGYGIIRNKKGTDTNKKIEYRLCTIPSSGEFYLNIEIENIVQIKDLEITVYVTGIRGKSRKGKKINLPEIFNYIPKTHDSGIGAFRTIKIISDKTES